MTDLMKLAQFLEAHPNLNGPRWVFLDAGNTPAEAKAAVAIFLKGAEGLVVKEQDLYNDDTINLIRTFGGLKVQMRVSKRTLGCQKIEKTQVIQVWECGPLLDSIKEVQ